MIWLTYRRMGGVSTRQVRRRTGDRWFVMDNGDSVHADQITEGRELAEALPVERTAMRPRVGALSHTEKTHQRRGW